MGLETLEGFRDSLNLTLGDQGQTNERLDRWINDGLQELHIMLDVEARRVCAEAPTVADQERYQLPTDCIAVLSLKDKTNKKLLLKTAIENYEQLDSTLTGRPKTWARIDRHIHLNPIPDAVYTLRIVYLKEPAVMSLSTDTTELTAAYDRVVHLLAVRSALLDLRQFDDATFFHQVAQNRLREIPNEFELESENAAETIQIARSREDLSDPRNTR